jgi:hypothetical protein
VVTRETTTREHFEDSILLAYLRRQQLEDGLSLRISQHIDIERCPRCCPKLDELARVSATLDVLGRMPSYQHYGELSVADTFARAQGAGSKETSSQADLYRTRQRPRKSAVRLVSLPVAIAITILFTIIAFALFSGEPLVPGLSHGGVRSNSGNPTIDLQNHATATPTLAATAVQTPTLTGTPTTGPYMEVCSTDTNISHWHLFICGHNFEPDSKVVLVALGKTATYLPNVAVNKQGDFQVGWVIDKCGNLPTIILSYQKADAKPILIKLQNIAFGDCPVPTATAGPPGT